MHAQVKFYPDVLGVYLEKQKVLFFQHATNLALIRKELGLPHIRGLHLLLKLVLSALDFQKLSNFKILESSEILTSILKYVYNLPMQLNERSPKFKVNLQLTPPLSEFKLSGQVVCKKR